jgi:hypothetical protein
MTNGGHGRELCWAHLPGGCLRDGEGAGALGWEEGYGLPVRESARLG